MRLLRLFAVMLICVIAATSCMGGGAGGDPDFVGQPHAIKFTWRATTDLNWFNERSHTIALYVVQAQKVKTLAKLKKSADQVLQFLEKGSKNKGVTNIDRIIVQPGGMQTDYLDLAPESACIGIIAAYYYLDAPKSVRVFGLPAGDDKKMSIDVVLGREALLKATKKEGGDW